VNFLFWNVAKRPQLELLRMLVIEHDIDVFALAEAGENVSAIAAEINRGALQLFYQVESVASRVVIFSKLPEGSIKLVSDDEEIFVRRIVPPIGKEILLVAVHFPSKLHMTDNAQTMEAGRLIRSIEEAEARVGHNRTLVIGDLNMNPFEPGMVASDALHSVMDKRVAVGSSRTVRGQEKTYLYNPMWKFFGGGENRPQGTYFYNDSSHICYFWNIFDQVLLRPDLLDYFPEESLKIVSSIGETSLLRKNGRIDVSISDHLPIVATLEVERTDDAG
jgi:endonuclease/exonuclease/phosphatase family metal-dependent hydrolase